MNAGVSVKITYWAEQIGENQLHDLDGVDDFRHDLEREYAAAIHGRPGDLGGGLLHLAVEFVSSISMADVATFLASGMAYDLIKEGTKSLVLRPFIRAYQRLKDRNRDNSLDIDVLRLVLRDSVIIIYRLADGSIVDNLGKILATVGAEYRGLVLRSGETPFEIHVPVFADPSDDRLSGFRVLLDVDEVIRPKPGADYFKLWGLHYDFSRTTRVYDVGRHLLIDEEFLTQDRYDIMWNERFRRSSGG